jgi:hypothetical protein
LGKENSSVNLTFFSNLMKNLQNFQYQKIGKKTIITMHNMIILAKKMVASLVIRNRNDKINKKLSNPP